MPQKAHEWYLRKCERQYRIAELLLRAGADKAALPDSVLAAFFQELPETGDQRDGKYAVAALLRAKGIAVPYDDKRDAAICYTEEGRLCPAAKRQKE